MSYYPRLYRACVFALGRSPVLFLDFRWFSFILFRLTGLPRSFIGDPKRHDACRAEEDIYLTLLELQLVSLGSVD